MGIARHRISAGHHEQGAVQHIARIEGPFGRRPKDITGKHFVACGECEYQNAPAEGLADRRVQSIDEMQHPLGCRRIPAGCGAKFGPEQPNEDRYRQKEQIKRKLPGAADETKYGIENWIEHWRLGPPTRTNDCCKAAAPMHAAARARFGYVEPVSPRHARPLGRASTSSLRKERRGWPRRSAAVTRQ